MLSCAFAIISEGRLADADFAQLHADLEEPLSDEMSEEQREQKRQREIAAHNERARGSLMGML